MGLDKSGCALYPLVDKQWCIGVCAVPCPSSVKLVRKYDAVPPKDFKELRQEISKQKKASKFS